MNICRHLGRLRRKRHQSKALVDIPETEVPEECRDWRQADVMDMRELPVIDADGSVRHVECAEGVAILSQSCDASKRDRATVQVARIVKLQGTIADEARRGRRPRYAPLPELGPEYFADLDVVATATKASLQRLRRASGVVADKDVNRFASTAARKVGRFAFPDQVVETFRSLQDDLFEKSRKSGSPMNKVIDHVHAFRVKIGSAWSRPPFEVTVHAILKPGAIPSFEGDFLPDEPRGLRNQLLGGKVITERVTDIAKHLGRADLSDADRYWSWQLMAEAWAARCRAAASKAGVSKDIRGVTVELFVADEYSLTQVDDSERLDLDYLSDPVPGAAD